MDIRRLTFTLKPAVSRDLTTIDLFKSMINKTNDSSLDDYLTWALKSASAQVEQYCNLTFAKESILDFFRLGSDWSTPLGAEWSLQYGSDTLVLNSLAIGRSPSLVLSRKPVTDLWAVIDSSCQATTLSGSMTDAQTTMACLDALPSLFPFNAVIGTNKSAEVVTVTGLTSGAYDVTRGVNANAVAHAAGDAVTVALDSNLFDLDGDAAILSRIPSAANPSYWHGGAVSVFYTGGYVLPDTPTARTLPYDIEEATINILRYAYFTRDRDPQLRSEGTSISGTKSYWVGAFGKDVVLPLGVEVILDNYRDRQF